MEKEKHTIQDTYIIYSIVHLKKWQALVMVLCHISLKRFKLYRSANRLALNIDSVYYSSRYLMESNSFTNTSLSGVQIIKLASLTIILKQNGHFGTRFGVAKFLNRYLRLKNCAMLALGGKLQPVTNLNMTFKKSI